MKGLPKESANVCFMSVTRQGLAVAEVLGDKESTMSPEGPRTGGDTCKTLVTPADEEIADGIESCDVGNLIFREVELALFHTCGKEDAGAG
jgi:hypothetical protein